MSYNWESPTHRVKIGTFGFFIAIALTFMATWLKVNETLVTTLYYASAGLIGAGIIKKFGRNENNNGQQ